ncbi:MAG: restriction endonuclease subunit S [Lachnospiraceae bacterium]|nr:restriction endonuclease subunit S [Lachnospiraceae bacterium]
MVLAQDLRNAVLQAALQGKLTEQFESDSKVSELLNIIENYREPIKKCKNSLNLESMNIKIPCSWKMVELNSILSFVDYRGKTPNKSTNGIFLITASNIKKGYMDYTRKEYISEKEYDDRQSRGITKKGDLLFTTEAPLGNVALCDLEVSSCGQRVITMQGYCENTVCLELFMYFLLSPAFQKELTDNCTGTTAKGIKAEKLKHLLIPFPPIEEQQRIVDRVNELMEKIDDYEKVEKELVALEQKFSDDMKNALLQAAMQGKLTEQLDSDSSVDEMLETIKKEKKQLIKEKKIKKEKTLPPIEEDDIPFEIPDNWKWTRWGDLAYSIQYGYNAPAKENGKIKMVRISDIQDNKVIWDIVPYCEIDDGDIETYLLKENDILFARTGGTVGKSFLVKEVNEKAIYAGYLIRTRYSNELVAQYLKYFMESQLYWVQLQNGKTKGCQPNCNGQTLSKMIIPLPPIEEQQRIVERLEQLLPLCETL